MGVDGVCDRGVCLDGMNGVCCESLYVLYIAHGIPVFNYFILLFFFGFIIIYACFQ